MQHFSIQSRWSMGTLLAALLLGAAGVLATLDAWSDLAGIALRDPEMSHIVLVPVVVVWLIWVRRQRLRRCTTQFSMVGPIVVVLGWCSYLAGEHLHIQSAWHGGAILVALGGALSVLGWSAIWRFLPAILALAFLIPVPGRIRQEVAIPAQNVAAFLTQNAMTLIGVDVARSGNLLTINDVDVTVAEACNGLRMVFALTMVSYVFAFGTPLKNYIRLLIIAASPALAIGANVVRLCVAVWFYGYYPASVAEWYHDLSGWLMLPASFVVLIALVRVLRWALLPVGPFTLATD